MRLHHGVQYESPTQDERSDVAVKQTCGVRNAEERMIMDDHLYDNKDQKTSHHHPLLPVEIVIVMMLMLLIGGLCLTRHGDTGALRASEGLPYSPGGLN